MIEEVKPLIIEKTWLEIKDLAKDEKLVASKKVTELYTLLLMFGRKSKVKNYDDVEISIKSNYTESELVLPNKEVLAGLGKGTRLIVQDKNGKMISIVVEEILYDCIYHQMGIDIGEIIISKG